jgi:hypothetical protein
MSNVSSKVIVNFNVKRITGFVITFLLFALTSCKKTANSNCSELKEAAYTDNVEKVKLIITNSILSLPSSAYNQQNLKQLAQTMAECDLESSVPCFDCIKTLPSQSEIVLKFFFNGVQQQKVIDLSYSTSNRIVFKNMHN